MPNRQNSIDRLEEFRQITAEFDVLKNRVRRIIGKRHFPTDGEWKESIVRTFLRRNLPDNIKVGRGFVGEALKTELYDKISKIKSPLLLMHGDQDTSVPVGQSMKAMELANEPKQLHIIYGAEHCFRQEQKEAVDVTVEFFKKYL